MNSQEIRNKFLDFFAQNGHEKVSSSSLIPAEDPTILFANAGMNQFKDLFLGQEKRSYACATTVQKCVRAGGKHNDLDNVGFTKRHLTFFEMMGNFSFGGYFKKEAIAYAWAFLTDVMGLDKDKLHVSVFETDHEAYALWHDDIAVPASRIHRLGAKDNFWQMGDVGPCGPCTEIYIDRGTLCTIKDNDLCAPGCDCDRFLEIWNLVFMQFERFADGTLKPLKQTGVDTGMGLERLCSVVQNQDSVFTTDLFMPIINEIEKITGIVYKDQSAEIQASFHVLADHIRSSTLLIADGCAPTNDGRGYVLRKIIRRAALFAQKLSDTNFFPELSRVVVKSLGSAYPALVANADLIYTILKSEIEKFSANLVRGNIILNKYLQESSTQTVTGQQAFKLYDTYGFPLELVVAAAREKHYTVDTHDFDNQMLKQKEHSGKKTADDLAGIGLEYKTTFTGYTEHQTESKVVALVHEGQLVDQVMPGQLVHVIAEQSPFFIVGGGQVPDQGTLTVNGIIMPLMEVRFINQAIAPQVIAQTNIVIGDAVISRIDSVWRTNAMKNHTATHLLQAAMIELFGKQIQQSGSLVHPDYLRFDFTYHQQLSAADIKQVEDLVNEKICTNIPVKIDYCTLKEAQGQGALAFFGEKYNPEDVRVVKVADFSTELCGGTHVNATGDIGVFKITETSALSAGHRRIVAVTGVKALELFQDTFSIVKTIGQDFKVKREDVADAVFKQKEQIKELQLKMKHLRGQFFAAQIPLWQESMDYVHGIPFLFLYIADATIEELRMVVTTLEKKQSGFYFAISSAADQTLFYTILSTEFVHVIDMKAFSSWLKERQGLRGGGMNNSIQGGGGKYNSGLDHAMKQWIESHGR